MVQRRYAVQVDHVVLKQLDEAAVPEAVDVVAPALGGARRDQAVLGDHRPPDEERQELAARGVDAPVRRRGRGGEACRQLGVAQPCQYGKQNEW